MKFRELFPTSVNLPTLDLIQREVASSIKYDGMARILNLRFSRKRNVPYEIFSALYGAGSNTIGHIPR